VADFIINHNGEVSEKPSKVVHMDFKVLYDKLKSEIPVNFISCP